MRLLLTSCGLETEQIKRFFLEMLGKEPDRAKALFIPTAAIDADAISVLPACLDDLLKCGIPKQNIVVFDLHKNMPVEELTTYDVVYLCGGVTSYLLQRINDTGFCDTLTSYIRANGLVIGVSAGSMIFAKNQPDHLPLIDMEMDVHCDEGTAPGKIAFPVKEKIALTNTAAIIVRNIPDDIILIDG